MSDRYYIDPQPGPQTKFLESRADIVIYGGAAGGGKSFGLLMDPLRHYANPLFKGIVFRRLTNEITMSGGLFDTAKELYIPLKGTPRSSNQYLDVTFPTGWNLAFRHLQYDDTVYQYQGLQVGWCGFDELTHFTLKQFMYIITRLRSMAGIKLRVRGTCNPDPDSWVKDMVEWYLDKEGRFADPKKTGKVRYFITDLETDKFLWANSMKEMIRKYGKKRAKFAKSFTFIPAKLSDNQLMVKKSPEYEANLAIQDKVTRARLLSGDWKIRPSAGSYFQRKNFKEVDYYPQLRKVVRFYDRAATEPSATNRDPDYTCSVKMGLTVEDTFVILDLSHERVSASEVERGIKNRATQEPETKIMAYEDPGAAGKSEAERFKKMLRAYDVDTFKITRNKETNAKSFAAQSQHGNVMLYRGIGQEEKDLFYSQLESFPEGGHDDYVDAGSGAYNELAGDDGDIQIF